MITCAFYICIRTLDERVNEYHSTPGYELVIVCVPVTPVPAHRVAVGLGF